MPRETARVVSVANGSMAAGPALPAGLELSGFYILECQVSRTLAAVVAPAWSSLLPEVVHSRSQQLPDVSLLVVS